MKPVKLIKNQTVEFKNLVFKIIEDRLYLVRCGNFYATPNMNLSRFNVVEVSVSGENKNTHLGAKMAYSTEWDKLLVVDYQIEKDNIVFILKNDKLSVKIHFITYQDTNAVRVFTEYKNISREEIVLEEASAFTVSGIGGIMDGENIKFTKFTQSHHCEVQPITQTFKQYGLWLGTGESQKKIYGLNVGSWSTKEELPQGIIQTTDGKYTLFQIESNNSWYYEIGDKAGVYYLYLGGANSTYGSWMKKLKPSESYRSVSVALAFGDSLNEVLKNTTNYRRHIKGICKADEDLPTIFNEYMHLSWDSPCEENTKKYAPVAKNAGVKYYVIDCGWHDEVETDIIYHYVGEWRESKKRFPSGIKATVDYIRSLGLKAGLWIEPEVVGFKNQKMIDFYGEDAFVRRNGKKVVAMNRLFLDYRNEKVREYMSETIRVMIEEYGAEYIKVDYNQDMGVGTEVDSFSFGEGLEKVSDAFYKWMEGIVQKYPNVVFEGCSSGGMRMDYKTLSLYSLASTSDQVDCYKYPYIAGNILSAVIPEQAAVWSYPVGGINGEFLRDVGKDWVDKNTTEDKVAVNMINSFLGRMHLASNLSLLDKNLYDLVIEGVKYYDKLSTVKKSAVPFLPYGFTNFGEDCVAAGLLNGDNLYLAVYNLGGEKNKVVPIGKLIKSVNVGYPISSNVKIEKNGEELNVCFTAEKQAIFIEVTL